MTLKGSALRYKSHPLNVPVSYLKYPKLTHRKRQKTPSDCSFLQTVTLFVAHLATRVTPPVKVATSVGTGVVSLQTYRSAAQNPFPRVPLSECEVSASFTVSASVTVVEETQGGYISHGASWG